MDRTDFRAKFKAIQKEYSPDSRMFYGHYTSVTDAQSTAIIVGSGTRVLRMAIEYYYLQSHTVRETILRASLTSARIL